MPPVDAELRQLDIDLPALPAALVQLSLLLAEDNLDVQAVSELVEADMALAAAVLRAVNSSMYGLKGRVQTVRQAVTYLGMREVSAITYEVGMRAAFPPSPEIEPLWQRATQRGLLMGRMGQRLGIDAWAAHSAGLFEECGKAVLLRHAPDHYPGMLRATTANDHELVSLEKIGFGVSHDALGAALCETWGLNAASVHCVRHHLDVRASGELPAQAPRRSLCALSVFAHALMTEPDTLEEVVARFAPQALLDEAQVLRAAHKEHERLTDLA